jgi:hypothetical protein
MLNSFTKKALFVVPGESLDTPSSAGYLSHKFDLIYETLIDEGWEVVVLIDIHSKRPGVHSKYKLKSLRVRYLFDVLAVLFQQPFSILRNSSPASFINQSAMALTYKKTVIREQPRLVLAIGMSESLVGVCQELGAHTAEIQHGMFGVSDLRTYWPNNLFPDSLLTWDQHSSAISESLGICPWTIGHPDAEYAISFAGEGLGDFVCVSLGHDSDTSVDPMGCLSESLASAIDSLEAFGIPTILRIHPLFASSKRKTRSLLNWIRKTYPNVRIDNPRETSLRKSIDDSFLNICGSSATWFEFALAGRSSLVLDQEWARRFELQALEIGVWKAGKSPILRLDSSDIKDVVVRAKNDGRAFTNPLNSSSIERFLKCITFQ